MLYALLGFVQWEIINNILQKLQEKKLAMNSTALMHATSTSLIMLFGKPGNLIYNTGGYFLFDMYYLFRYREINFQHMLYYYHHMAILYYMNLSISKYNWFNIVGIGELSNIPTYFVYYYLKTQPKSKSLKKWKLVQKIWFGFIRFFICTALTYHELKDPVRFKTLLPVIPVYLMGLVWGGAMMTQ